MMKNQMSHDASLRNTLFLLEKLFIPLAMIALRMGVKESDCSGSSIWKSAFFKAAKRLKPDLSDSAAADFAGVHQKIPPSDLPKMPTPRYASAVLSRWRTSSDYSSNGAPRILPISGPDSFQELVQESISERASYRAILAELTEAGCVELSGFGVKMIKPHLIGISPACIEGAISGITAHANAISENILAGGGAHIERTVRSVKIKDKQAFADEFGKLCEEFHTRSLHLIERHESTAGDHVAIFGIYCYSENQDDPNL